MLVPFPGTLQLLLLPGTLVPAHSRSGLNSEVTSSKTSSLTTLTKARPLPIAHSPSHAFIFIVTEIILFTCFYVYCLSVSSL